MNTLFRVLYTVAIQWRTYMMYCGPDGGWGCFSLMSREMVRQYLTVVNQINELCRTAPG